jgi:hypothetical protein
MQRRAALAANALVREVVADATEFPSRSLERDVAHAARHVCAPPPSPLAEVYVVVPHLGASLVDMRNATRQTVRCLARNIHRRYGIARFRQRILFRGDVLPWSSVPLSDFGVRDRDTLYVEVARGATWVARLDFRVALSPAPNADVGRLDALRLVVHGCDLRRRLEDVVRAAPPPAGGLASLHRQVSVPRDLRVRVDRVRPVLKARLVGGGVRAWWRHEALGAVRVLAERLPQELVARVLDFLVRPPAEWERDVEEVAIRPSVGSVGDDIVVVVRPEVARWPAHAHLRVVVRDVRTCGDARVRGMHPLVDVDDDAAHSGALRNHTPFRTWHVYTGTELHAPPTVRTIAMAREVLT